MNRPVAVLCVGMAGSGKTTFMQRMTADLHANPNTSTPYIINLDPATLHLPYSPNIDIRDTVNYKEVMRQYKLGPNGGILTCLNLFTTRFDQVLEALEKREQRSNTSEKVHSEEEEEEEDGSNQPSNAAPLNHILVDTPGQIEIFTWSASGAIITEALASQYPTVLAYVVDTERCQRPATFMANMLYACSILYKCRLPMILVFNKTDLQSAEPYLAWMQDVILFQEALAQDESYMSSLVQSMSLVLEEFYKTLRVVAVSAFTGEGMEEFFEKVQEGVKEYEEEYLVQLKETITLMRQRQQEDRDESVTRLMKDLNVNDNSEGVDNKKVESDTDN